MTNKHFNGFITKVGGDVVLFHSQSSRLLIMASRIWGKLKEPCGVSCKQTKVMFMFTPLCESLRSDKCVAYISILINHLHRRYFERFVCLHACLLACSRLLLHPGQRSTSNCWHFCLQQRERKAASNNYKY